jgi:hypothetical protein
MRPKLKYAPEEKESMYKPGPASYNHEKLSVLENAASWKIGTERRVRMEKYTKWQAAPNQYTPSHSLTRVGSSKAIFGTSKRPGPIPLQKIETPSPAHYDLPT